MSMNQQQKMQPPYIGSKISLISKLDIRYEGTLYTVDAIESTIALAKVHSYGTEDRHTPVFVPARDEIYDFIIFKASDIKDLIVCEPPKATNVNNPLASGLPYDPAIVSISKNPPPEPKLPTKLNNLSINEKHHGQQQQRPFNSFLREGTSNGLDPNAYDGTPMFNYRTSGSNNVGGRSSREALARPNNQHSFYFQPPQNPHHQQRQPLSQVVDSIQPFINNSQSQHNSQMRLKFDNDYDFEKANELFREISEELKPKMEKMDLSGKSVSVETAEKPEYAEDENTKTIESVMKDENSGTDENIAAIKMREQTVEPIEKDEFEGKMGKVEEEIMSAKGGQQEKENADFYDKSASFFDNISCDALEKEAGKNVRPDWKRERQTNQETFGHSAVRSLFYHRRGSTRGFGMAPVRFNYRFPNFQQQPRLAQQQQQQAGYRQY